MSSNDDEKPIQQPIIDDGNEDEQFTDLSSLSEDVLAEAMRQLTNPNKPCLVEEVPALDTTTTTTTTEEIDTPKKNVWENQEDLAVNSTNGKNARSLVCPFCLKSCIILPNAGAHVEIDIFMIHPNAAHKDDGATHKDFFKITSKMDFENIEVKRAHEGDNFRYLTCADCGSGPLGVTYDADNNRIFYVSHDRTRYGKK